MEGGETVIGMYYMTADSFQFKNCKKHLQVSKDLFVATHKPHGYAYVNLNISDLPLTSSPELNVDK